MSALEIILSIVVISVIVISALILLKSRSENSQTKILNLLQKLSDIIISSMTSVEEVAQKVSDAIAFDLGFQVGVILLIDNHKKVLKRVAVSRTEKVKEAIAETGIKFTDLETSLDDFDNLTVQVAHDGKPRTTNFVYDVLRPHISEEQAAYIQTVGELSQSLVFPIYGSDQRIGVMIFSFSKKDKEVTDVKKKFIVRVLEEVGIALDNARLYEDLRITSKQLERANSRLKELDQLKNDFVSVASHELRTPMTGIKSFLWMALNNQKDNLTPDLKRYLDRAYISTQRLISLVNDMLNISRIEGGRIALKLTEVDLPDLAREVYEELSVKAAEKDLEIVIGKERIPKVLCDRDKIHEVFINLIGNSMKFTPQKGRIDLVFKKDGETVVTDVHDNGHGIAKEDLVKLFTKFGRLENSYVAVAESGGTGLGLYITKSLVEVHKGKVRVASEGLGKGATFSFSLPIAGSALAQTLQKDAPSETAQTKDLEKTTINL